MDESNPEKRPTVAVVAVHGVGDQIQNATVRKISDLIAARKPQGSRSTYTAGREVPIRIATRAVQLAEEDRAKTFPSFHELSLASHTAGRGVIDPSTTEPEPVDFAFTRQVLKDAPAPTPEGVYETIRVETSRLHDARPAIDVHLYELYWTDLSRHGTGAIQVFAELYQILCHFGTLGRSTVDAAALRRPGSRRWNWYSRLQSWATDALTIWLVAINIIIVGLAVMVTLAATFSHLESKPIGWIPPWLILGVLGLLVAAIFTLCRQRRNFVAWATMPLIIGLSICLGIALPGATSRLSGLIAMAAGVTVCVLIVNAYKLRRPGAGSAALITGIIISFRVLYPLFWETSQKGLIGVSAAISGFELVLKFILPFCWFVFLALLCASSIAGISAIREVGDAQSAAGADPQTLDRARRSAFTARLVLSLSALFFTLITILLWAGFWTVIRNCSWFPSSTPYRSLYARNDTIGHFFDSMFQGPRVLEFEIFAVIIALSAVFGAWALGPVAFEEVKPPENGGELLAQGIGSWLDSGFRLLGYVGEFIFLGVAVTVFVYILEPFKLHWLDSWSGGALLGFASAFVGASVVGLAAFRGRLGDLAMGFRPIVDLLLDVDNHLREFPHGKNPRALISARFVSLLRYLSQWRDASGLRSYQGVVIIAHSQGTAITADLLRFLKHEWPAIRGKDPELAPILDRQLPLYFFTMGSPLRQLYSLRFPMLYKWARHTDTSVWSPDTSLLIPDDQLPDPDSLGVKCWVNAFRSGDYVGRYLWRPDRCNFQWSLAESHDRSLKRIEFCIGAGAHTHYWDHTAHRIADELDRLICIAAQAEPVC